MLVVTPAPYPSESLFGYLIRLSESNGYHTPTIATSYAGYPRGGLIGLNSDLRRLSKITGVQLRKLKSIGYTSEGGGSPLRYSLLGVQLSNGLANQYLRPKQQAICPECIQDIGHVEAYWDLSVAVACPRHGIEAVRNCPTCGEKIGWLRPGLLTCRCGASLTSGTCQEISGSMRHLLAMIRGHLHGKRAAGVGATGFSKQLESLTLMELLFLVHTLSKFGIHLGRQNRSGRPNSYFDFKVAANALADWPYGLHRYLSRLGEHLQRENGVHVGLRKQFSSFYHALFRSKLHGKTFEFVREEFVRFGSITWGRSVVDKKLYRTRTASIDVPKRFVSVSGAASRLRVSPQTLRTWCAAGQIPCQSLKTKKAMRFVVDSQYISDFERKPGETLEEREAAAFVGIPVSVLRALKTSALYSSDHLPRIMGGYHKNDLKVFRERLEKAARAVSLKTPHCVSQSTLDSVLKSTKWWATGAKVNFLCSYLDGRIEAVGKATNDPLSVFFDEEQVHAFMNKSKRSDDGEALTLSQAAKRTACSSECISEMIKREILTASQGTGCRVVCAISLRKFDERYLALNALAKRESTSANKLMRLALKIGLDVLKIKVPRGFTTTFVQQEFARTLMDAFERERDERLAKKRVENADNRDIQAVKRYLDDLTRSQRPLPRRGNQLNKAAIAKASGIHRNSIYNVAEIQRLLEAHSKQDARSYGIRTESQIEILEKYLQVIAGSNQGLPLKPNGEPHKQQIAQEAGIARYVFYQNDDANRLLERHLCSR